MPILYIHTGEILLMAQQARDRAKQAVAANADAMPSDATVAIILSAAATEAFINELAESISFTKESQYMAAFEPLDASLSALADAIREIEQSKGQTLLKYLVASLLLTGRPIDRSRHPYQDLATLIRLRNDLMHLKPSDTMIEASEGGIARIEIPKYIGALQERGLARKSREKEIGPSWFNVLQTVEMASWSCDTASSAVNMVLEWADDKTRPDSFVRKMFQGLRAGA